MPILNPGFVEGDRPTWGPRYTPFDFPPIVIQRRQRPETRPSWGPIYTPPSVPEVFGPIYSPPTTSPEQRGKRKMGGFLPGIISARTDILRGIGQVIGGVIQTAGQQPTVTVGPPGVQVTVPLPGNLPVLGQFQTGLQVAAGPCAGTGRMNRCTRSVTVGGRTTNRKGRWILNEAGQLICCPTRRRLNPMNGKAAIRAARRLKGVFKFQRRVEKALQRACRGSGVRRSATARSCKRCK
jgi:hypothetical protein